MIPPEGCDRYREQIGAFVLGKLEGAELEAMQTHLNGCHDCWAEVRELQPVVAALADADPDRIDEYQRPPSSLEESTLAPISEEIHRAQSSRRRYGWASLAAAAIFAVVIGLAGLTWLVEPAAALEPLSFYKETGVQPRGFLIEHASGTEIRLVASGLLDGQKYKVTLIGEDGERVNAGTFIGAGGTPVKGTFTAALSRKDAARLEVRAPGSELAFYSELPEKPQDKIREWPLFGVLPWAPDPKDEIIKSSGSGGKEEPGAEDRSPSDATETPKADGSGGGTPPHNEIPREGGSSSGSHGQPPPNSPSASPQSSASPGPSASPEPSVPPAEPPTPACSQYSPPNGRCA